ncbi:MAG: PQQ-dependent sugar dehydrogenase [Chloroflexota bacterium]
MKKLFFLLFLMFFALVGCQAPATDVVVETPPIIVEESVQVEPTSEPPTAVSEPELPTAEATIAIEQPTNTPEPEPTATPEPLTVQLANSIQLVSVLPAGQLFKPIYLTHAFDDRLFVVEQAGTIRIMANGSLLPDPFLDIQDLVNSDANEQGLLSVAFHPSYEENGRFFVNYTDGAGSTVISSFQVQPDNPNLADSNSEQILMSMGQPYNNHNGGQIKFGPDGYLYIGMGDGGSAGDPDNNGQTFSTLLGNMLRIDIDANNDSFAYGVPASNPFINDDGVRNEIWATGLRNPWRFSFDRLTGDLFIADVGQNEWEEVNYQPFTVGGGQNYGWNWYEGNNCFFAGCDPNGLTFPVVEYNHSDGCSITGGYVYRGEAHSALWGNYFFTDYCTGNVWSMVDVDGQWQSAIVLNTGRLVASFGEDMSGELYMLDHRSGEILQIRP